MIMHVLLPLLQQVSKRQCRSWTCNSHAKWLPPARQQAHSCADTPIG